MAGRVIHIVDGIKLNTARWSLKMELEVYGKIDACHMGDRSNPHKQPPWVKFNTREAAERCMEAIAEGKVFVNGYKVKAEYRKETSAPSLTVDSGGGSRDLDLTSRDLFMKQAAGGGGGGGSRALLDRKRRSPSSSRSRRRRRRRSDSRSRSRRKGRDRDRDRDRRRKGRDVVAIEDNKPMAIEDNKPLAIEDTTGGEAVDLQKERHGTCGHLLTPVIPRGREIALVECDFCGQMQARGAPMLCCRQCEYDMCIKCADRACNQVLD